MEMYDYRESLRMKGDGYRREKEEKKWAALSGGRDRWESCQAKPGSGRHISLLDNSHTRRPFLNGLSGSPARGSSVLISCVIQAVDKHGRQTCDRRVVSTFWWCAAVTLLLCVILSEILWLSSHSAQISFDLGKINSWLQKLSRFPSLFIFSVVMVSCEGPVIVPGS